MWSGLDGSRILLGLLVKAVVPDGQLPLKRRVNSTQGAGEPIFRRHWQLDQIDDPIGQVTADGGYDGASTCQRIAGYGEDIAVVIPLHSTAVPSDELDPPTRRDGHLAMIAEHGRQA